VTIETLEVALMSRDPTKTFPFGVLELTSTDFVDGGPFASAQLTVSWVWTNRYVTATFLAGFPSATKSFAVTSMTRRSYCRGFLALGGCDYGLDDVATCRRGDEGALCCGGALVLAMTRAFVVS